MFPLSPSPMFRFALGLHFEFRFELDLHFGFRVSTCILIYIIWIRQIGKNMHSRSPAQKNTGQKYTKATNTDMEAGQKPSWGVGGRFVA